MPKLFEFVVTADESGRQEFISGIIVATSSLNHRTEVEKDISKLALKLFKQLCETADKMHNSQMKGVLTYLAVFLYKSIKDTGTEKSFVKFIVQEIEKYFSEGNRSSKYTILYEIVRRYHVSFEVFLCF